MKTQVLLIVNVEHDGSLTPTELANTVGCWVENIPVDMRTVLTQTDDRADCHLVVFDCEASRPV